MNQRFKAGIGYDNSMKKYAFRFATTLSLCLLSCTTYHLTPEAQEIIKSFSEPGVSGQSVLLNNTPYQTPFFIFDSGKPGSVVLILGGTHGDEPAGYETALRLVKIFQKKPPRNGKVILIPLANRKAVNNFNRRITVPDGADIEKGNLNRCYPGKKEGFPMERMAWQIQRLVIENGVDIFIDLHEARYLHLNTPKESKRDKGLGQTIIFYPNEKSAWLVLNMLDQINETIGEKENQFSAVEEPILNSAAWWAGTELGIASFTFETARILNIQSRINYHQKLVQIVLEESEIW